MLSYRGWYLSPECFLFTAMPECDIAGAPTPAAELRSGRQDAAGTLTKRICKTCRGKAIPPGLSAAQVLALHRGHKVRFISTCASH